MGRVTPAFIISFFIMAGGGTYGFILRNPPNAPVEEIDLRSIPLSAGGWMAREKNLGMNIERVLGVDKYIYREYVNQGGKSVWLFVGYFASQKFGSNVHSPRHCLPGSGWEIINRTTAPLPGDNSLIVKKLDIARGGARHIMYYWFTTRAGHLTNEFSLKGDLVVNSLLGRPTDAAFIRINAPVENPTSMEAEKRIAEFMRFFLKDIYSALPF